MKVINDSVSFELIAKSEHLVKPECPCMPHKPNKPVAPIEPPHQVFRHESRKIGKDFNLINACSEATQQGAIGLFIEPRYNEGMHTTQIFLVTQFGDAVEPVGYQHAVEQYRWAYQEYESRLIAYEKELAEYNQAMREYYRLQGIYDEQLRDYNQEIMRLVRASLDELIHKP